MDTWACTREAVNWLNLSTLAGLGLANASRCRMVRGHRGILLARNYPLPWPKAGAFTVGNVVFLRARLSGPDSPAGLLAHEETHATQYALFLGLPFLPLYFAAAGYSWLRTSDSASMNPFERAAGLQAGGYREFPSRPLMPVLLAGSRRVFDRIPRRSSPPPFAGGTA